jgi:DeoR/GlpR family transcriptional regulator of sugar metabolism
MSSNSTRNSETNLQEILRQINHYGKITSNDLSDQLNIPIEILNSNLLTLAEMGSIFLTHNGAASRVVGLYELSLNLRSERQDQEKSQIGETCASMIEDNETVFMDSSSTSIAIASRLKNRRNITIITNCLRLAQNLQYSPGMNTYVIGGSYVRETDSLTGIEGLNLIKNKINKGFFGAYGISISEGLTDVSAAEAELKSAVVGICQKVVVAVDSTKWNRIARYAFAHLNQVSRIVTDTNAPAETIEQVRAMGIEVRLV